MCIEQVEFAWSAHAMVHIDLDALQQRHESVIERIVDLQETLLRAEKKEVLVEERYKGQIAQVNRMLRMRLM